MGGKRFTKEQNDFLMSICSNYDDVMAEMFNERFSANISARSIKDWCYRNKVPKRKSRTSFEKGCKTWNYNIDSWDKKPVGYERITPDGHIKIKHSEHKPMRLKHHVVWEKHHGEIPKGSVILFKNLDKTDCRIENLIIVTRAEQARLNQLFLHLSNAETNLSCILMAKLKQSIHNARTIF